MLFSIFISTFQAGDGVKHMFHPTITLISGNQYIFNRLFNICYNLIEDRSGVLQLNVFSIILSFGLLLLIFSPIIFSNKQKNGMEHTGWKGIFKSKWFGIPFIFLLLCGKYSETSFLHLVLIITFSIVVSLFISLIANRKLWIKNNYAS